MGEVSDISDAPPLPPPTPPPVDVHTPGDGDVPDDGDDETGAQNVAEQGHDDTDDGDLSDLGHTPDGQFQAVVEELTDGDAGAQETPAEESEEDPLRAGRPPAGGAEPPVPVTAAAPLDAPPPADARRMSAPADNLAPEDPEVVEKDQAPQPEPEPEPEPEGRDGAPEDGQEAQDHEAIGKETDVQPAETDREVAVTDDSPGEGDRPEAEGSTEPSGDSDSGEAEPIEADGSDRLTALADRPALPDAPQDPDDGPVPDRYGTPLDRTDGTRSPAFDGEPGRGQIQQGQLGDCGVIAVLGSVASHRPEVIREGLKETEDGNYKVFLHEARSKAGGGGFEPTGRRIELTVTPDLPVFEGTPGRPAFADSVDTSVAWGSIYEKAIAASDETWVPEHQDAWAQSVGGDDELPRGYARLDLGSVAGEQAELLTQLTGQPSLLVDHPRGDDAAGRSPDEQLESDIRERLAEGKPVIVGTHLQEDLGGAPLPKDLVEGHAYEVIAVDDQGRFHLHNPWNELHPQPLTQHEFRTFTDPPYITLE